MKYKTTIELICDAENKEEALNIAGEYLKGDMDLGVDLSFKANSLCSVKVKRVALGMVVMCVFVAGIFAPQYLNTKGTVQRMNTGSSIGSFTVQPELKTQSETDFKQKWREKKEKAILDYIKN